MTGHAVFHIAVWNILVLDIIAMWLYEVCVPQGMLLQLIPFYICLLNSMICGYIFCAKAAPSAGGPTMPTA
jgi:hypothetical protein